MTDETEPSSIRQNPARESTRRWKGRSGSPSGSVMVCGGSHIVWRPNAASATPSSAPSGKANRLAKPALPAGISPATATTSQDRKSTRLNSSHVEISYAVFCLKKKKKKKKKRK